MPLGALSGWLVNVTVGCYRALLFVGYPRRFRRRYGPQMVQLFGDRCRAEARRAGAPAVVRFWVAALADLATNAFALRLRAGETSPIAGAAEDHDHRDGARRAPGSETSGPGPSRRRSSGVVEMLVQDLRFAWKLIGRAPGFFAVALLTLSLGMAAAIAMFSVVNGVLIKQMPFEEPGRIVHILGSEGAGRWAISYPDYVDIRDRSGVFVEAAAWQGWGATFVDADGVSVVRTGASVSANFFDLLGVRPAHGRFFSPEESESGHRPVIVISYELWQSQFGGRPGVLGETVTADDAYTIVGVAPPGFIDPVSRSIWGSVPQLWRSRPAAFDAGTAARDWYGFWGLGRLAPGVSIEQAEARLAGVAADLQELYPDTNRGRTFRLSTVKELTVGEARSTLLLLLGAVGLLLLIACANVANLLLSRGVARRQEIAVRAALGASRGRLIGQVLVESILFSSIATVLGLTVAAAVVPGLVDLAASGLPRPEAIGLDANVAVVAALAALLTALTFGTAPALQLGDLGAAPVVRDGGRGCSPGIHRTRLRHALVVSQTAMAVLLLVGAGLLFKSLWRLASVDLGIDTESVLTLRVRFGSGSLPTPAAQNRVLERVRDGLAVLPGVEAVAAVSNRPMSGTFDSTPVSRDDQPTRPADELVRPLVRAITPDYHAVMKIPILRGREFTSADREYAPMVAILNQEAARQLWGGGDPIGGRVTVRGVSREVVGVVGNVHHFGPAGEMLPALYQPAAQTRQQWILASMTLMLRTAQDPLDLAATVRRAVSEVDGNLAINAVASMHDVVADQIAAPRFRTLLALLFAGTATALAAIGLAGVMAYAVSQQRHEIAVRMALGARQSFVVAGVLARGTTLALAGVSSGMLAAFFTSRLVASLLFEVTPNDAGVFVGAPALLAAVAALSTVLPAVRAARVDPATVLRGE